MSSDVLLSGSRTLCTYGDCGVDWVSPYDHDHRFAKIVEQDVEAVVCTNCGAESFSKLGCTCTCYSGKYVRRSEA